MAKDGPNAPPAPDAPTRDVALIHGVTEQGDLRVLRQRGDQLEAAAVRPLREGVPITGEVVKLTPRKEFPLLCDVTTEFNAPAAVPESTDVAGARGLPHKGPAQVATDTYRSNWDVIWAGSKPKAGLEN